MHVKELNSISLIKLCGKDKDNHTAWEEFLSRFLRKIKIHIIRSCIQARRESSYLSSQISLIPAQEVDDLAQQVLMRMIEKDCLLLRRFSGKTERDVCAYLAVLARSVTRNHYKELRRKKRPPIECSMERLSETRTGRLSAALANAQTGDGIEESFFRKELIGRLYATVRVRYSSVEASDRAAMVFDLYFFQGFTADEISKCKGINLSPPGVSKLVSTLRRDLKQHVKDHTCEPGPLAAVAHNVPAKPAYLSD